VRIETNEVAAMEVELHVEGDAVDHVESLLQFLYGESAVQKFGHLGRATNEDRTKMGVVLEVLTLVLGTGLSASQLVVAIAQWRASLRSGAPPAVTITTLDQDGTIVRIETNDPQILADAARKLERP